MNEKLSSWDKKIKGNGLLVMGFISFISTLYSAFYKENIVLFFGLLGLTIFFVILYIAAHLYRRAKLFEVENQQKIKLLEEQNQQLKNRIFLPEEVDIEDVLPFIIEERKTERTFEKNEENNDFFDMNYFSYHKIKCSQKCNNKNIYFDVCTDKIDSIDLDSIKIIIQRKRNSEATTLEEHKCTEKKDLDKKEEENSFKWYLPTSNGNVSDERNKKIRILFSFEKNDIYDIHIKMKQIKEMPINNGFEKKEYSSRAILGLKKLTLSVTFPHSIDNYGSQVKTKSTQYSYSISESLSLKLIDNVPRPDSSNKIELVVNNPIPGLKYILYGKKEHEEFLDDCS